MHKQVFDIPIEVKQPLENRIVKKYFGEDIIFGFSPIDYSTHSIRLTVYHQDEFSLVRQSASIANYICGFSDSCFSPG